jgi:hypothetical protein
MGNKAKLLTGLENASRVHPAELYTPDAERWGCVVGLVMSGEFTPKDMPQRALGIV